MDIFGFYLTTTDLWLLAIAGACIAFLLNFWRERHNRRVVACSVFRATIDRELFSLLSNWPQNIDKILISRFQVIDSAVREFRHHVPLLKKRGFDRAWFVYQYGSDGADVGSHYYQYMGYSSPDKVIPDSKETFKANVEHLLSYGKET